MRNGCRQFNMPHPFAAHFGQSHFDSAFAAHNLSVSLVFILAAQARVVFYRPENLRAEQAVAFGLQRAIVNCLGLFDLAIRPRAYIFGGRKTDANAVKNERVFLVRAFPDA